MPARHAIVLFAHGARDPRWAQPFEAVAQAVRTQCDGVPVQLAFLEFMSPTLLQAADSVVSQGADDIAIVPLFLGAGGHVRKDLPVLLGELHSRHPGVQFRLQPAIGERASIIQAMAHEVAQDLTRPPPNGTAHGEPSP